MLRGRLQTIFGFFTGNYDAFAYLILLKTQSLKFTIENSIISGHHQTILKLIPHSP